MPFKLEDNLPVSHIGKEDSLLPELLHALSQPLTSLRCSLEVTLVQPRGSDEYRRRLKESLGLAEEVAILTNGIRELLDAEKPGVETKALDLSKLAKMTFREFVPVADEKLVKFSLVCDPGLQVTGAEYQFCKALFYLLDFMLGTACKRDDLAIRVSSCASGVEILFELNETIHSDRERTQLKGSAAAKSYLTFLIARRIFEVEGGRLRMERTPSRLAILVELPQTTAQNEDEKLVSPQQMLKSAS